MTRKAKKKGNKEHRFKHYPAGNVCGACEDARAILISAHNASTSFLDIFDQIRKDRSAKGATTDEEQDLLRAMLLFSAAGLDALVKQLVRDALPNVIEQTEGADANFSDFVRKTIRRNDAPSSTILADVLSSRDSRQFLINHLVNDLTSNSLQSAEQLLTVASYFDIPTVTITPNINALKDVFRIRNQISHEMDIHLEQTRRSRRQRAKADMISHTNNIFGVAHAFLYEVNKKMVS